MGFVDRVFGKNKNKTESSRTKSAGFFPQWEEPHAQDAPVSPSLKGSASIRTSIPSLSGNKLIGRNKLCNTISQTSEGHKTESVSAEPYTSSQPSAKSSITQINPMVKNLPLPNGAILLTGLSESDSSNTQSGGGTIDDPVKRGRGRPRTRPVETIDPKDKRPRGRPRKELFDGHIDLNTGSTETSIDSSTVSTMVEPIHKELLALRNSPNFIATTITRRIQRRLNDTPKEDPLTAKIASQPLPMYVRLSLEEAEVRVRQSKELTYYLRSPIFNRNFDLEKYCGYGSGTADTMDGKEKSQSPSSDIGKRRIFDFLEPENPYLMTAEEMVNPKNRERLTMFLAEEKSRRKRLLNMQKSTQWKIKMLRKKHEKEQSVQTNSSTDGVSNEDKSKAGNQALMTELRSESEQETACNQETMTKRKFISSPKKVVEAENSNENEGISASCTANIGPSPLQNDSSVDNEDMKLLIRGQTKPNVVSDSIAEVLPLSGMLKSPTISKTQLPPMDKPNSLLKCSEASLLCKVTFEGPSMEDIFGDPFSESGSYERAQTSTDVTRLKKLSQKMNSDKTAKTIEVSLDDSFHTVLPLNDSFQRTTSPISQKHTRNSSENGRELHVNDEESERTCLVCAEEIQAQLVSVFPCCNGEICLECMYQVLIRRSNRKNCVFCQSEIPEEFEESVLSRYKTEKFIAQQLRLAALSSLRNGSSISVHMLREIDSDMDGDEDE